MSDWMTVAVYSALLFPLTSVPAILAQMFALGRWRRWTRLDRAGLAVMVLAPTLMFAICAPFNSLHVGRPNNVWENAARYTTFGLAVVSLLMTLRMLIRFNHSKREDLGLRVTAVLLVAPIHLAGLGFTLAICSLMTSGNQSI